jgi:hypothetical protein
MIAFTIFVGSQIGQFFRGKGTRAPRSTDATFQVADVAQFEIQEHEWACICCPRLVWNHVLESVQGVHAFAGAARAFFSPALSTGLWLFLIQELLSKILHVGAVLYACEAGGVEIKLVTCIIHNLFLSQTTRPDCADGTGF